GLRPGVRPLTLVRINWLYVGSATGSPQAVFLSFNASALFGIYCRCVAWRGTHDDRSADRWPAYRILSNGAEPTPAAEGGPRGRRRHSGTRSALFPSHYPPL